MDENTTKDKGGRPKGATSRFSKEAIARARATGDGRLPHEILLSIARGEIQSVHVLDEETGEVGEAYLAPTFDEMRDSAKAAAPYYAPKLSTVETLPGISDADLDQFIASLAAEAGVSLGANGTSPPPQAPAGEGTGAPASGSGSDGWDPTRIRRRPVTRT